jgi:TRAP-type C4-dicarboxylate transport system substrate-binding protein
VDLTGFITGGKAMRMSKRRVLSLTAVAAFTLGSWIVASQPAVAQEKTLKVQTFFSPASDSTVFWKAWAEEIGKKSNGRLKIEVFPSMQLGGKPGDLYNQARDGVVDGMFTLIGVNPGRFPKAGVFELPFIAENAEIGSAAIMELWETTDWLKDEFGDIVPIAVYATPGNALNTKKAVTTLDDFKGLRIRAATKAVSQGLENMGAAAVGMPMPDAIQGMQQGVIDGIATSWAVSRAFKICDISDHHTDMPGLSLGVLVFGFNKDSWNGLSPDLQELLRNESSVALAQKVGLAGDASQNDGMKACAESGEVHTVDPAEYARWKEKWVPITEAWLNEMKEKGIDGEALLSDARRLVEKHKM